MRVFAVDDEASILELLGEALPVLGCDDVRTASSAQEALDILTAEKPQIDCFLLDIQMPYIDGITLCSKIRNIDIYKNIPIIMLTAMSEKSYVDDAFQVGATDYLTKPFDMAELSTRLQLAIKHRQVHADETGLKMLAGGSFVEPVEESESVERVISLTAFENYVLHMTRARLVTAGLFAIKIPEMHRPGKSLSTEEIEIWKKTLSQAVSEATQYDQSLISYADNGVFLVLNKSWGTNKKEPLEVAIAQIFDELYPASERGGEKRPTVVVGSVVSLPAFGRSFTLSYLRKAIRRAEELCKPAPAPKPQYETAFGRRRKSESKTSEYKKMLSDVIDEIDPLAEKDVQGSRIVPRRVASAMSRRQLRTAV